MNCDISFFLIMLIISVVNASFIVQIRGSPITLEVAAHINVTGGSHALLKADRARLERLLLPKQFGYATQGLPVALTNAQVTYTASIGVGNPPDLYTLLVDTGSSNTWIGAMKTYTPTSSSVSTGDEFFVPYGRGAVQGKEYVDDLKIGSATIRQSIGVATSVEDISGVDGILGIGPAALTIGSLSPDNDVVIPTVTDNLKTQGYISEGMIGIFFEPSSGTSLSGELNFGATDPLRYNGDINYVPITTSSPASEFWGIDQDISYGTSTPILTGGSGIVDTGTTLILLTSDAYSNYVTATGAVMDSTTGLLSITEDQYDNLQSLFFTIGGVQYEFTANAQLWPRDLNAAIGGSPSSIYLIVGNSGQIGLNINGFSWIQRFYCVFDTDNARLGFATTPFTKATTN